MTPCLYIYKHSAITSLLLIIDEVIKVVVGNLESSSKVMTLLLNY
jgi:hypothetical protein